ncbi:MAG: ATP-binding cassette domain-containing protein [Thermodesulfovibrionales bacterium]
MKIADMQQSANAVAVETFGLNRRFGSSVAVDSLNLRVASGAIFGLLGTNGAGKSTTIKMLTTLLAPSTGTARVAGFDVVLQPQEVRRNIGYVSQMLSADGQLTGYENLLISAKIYGIPRMEREKRIKQAIDFIELSSVASTSVSHYSGGMIRRLEIAQSMLHRPAILFLDEPTVGLDPVAKHSVWQRIYYLRQEFGTTIFMTTHDMEEADKLCDRVAFMHRGHIVALDSPVKLKKTIGPEATLDDVFIHCTGTSIDERGDYRDAARTRHTAERVE